MGDDKIAQMIFSSVYPHYLNKVVKKGRTKEELDEVIMWLTGFTQKQLQKYIDTKITFKEMFDRATLHPNANKINGVICGYRVEDIKNLLTKLAGSKEQIKLSESTEIKNSKGNLQSSVLKPGVRVTVVTSNSEEMIAAVVIVCGS
jgi:hypothetical protein